MPVYDAVHLISVPLTQEVALRGWLCCFGDVCGAAVLDHAPADRASGETAPTGFVRTPGHLQLSDRTMLKMHGRDRSTTAIALCANNGSAAHAALDCGSTDVRPPASSSDRQTVVDFFGQLGYPGRRQGNLSRHLMMPAPGPADEITDLPSLSFKRFASAPVELVRADRMAAPAARRPDAARAGRRSRT